MYAAYDDSGNWYLILELIVNYWKHYKAIKVPNKKVVHRGQSFIWQSTVVWNLCV